MAKKRKTRTRKVNTKNWGQRGTKKQIAATIAIPSGKCPFVMEDSNRETVLEWLAKLTFHKPIAHTYKRSVYTYWVRQSFDMFRQRGDHINAVNIINEVVPEYTKKVSDLGFPTSDFLED